MGIFTRFFRIIFCGFFLSALAFTAFAQDGTLDATFNPADIGFGNGDGANSTVTTSAVQTDGKIIIAGNYTFYNGTARNRVARLNPDGSLDASFNVGTGANATIQTSLLQPDGKIIIAGNFSSFGGIARGRIARLNADGSLDPSFNPGTGTNLSILTLSLQPDGKVIIGGDFTTFNGTARNRIARLNTDGSLDAGFDIGTGANSNVLTSFVQPDGMILIGGDFTTYNGIARGRIARLNTDGSLDAGFNPGTGGNANVLTLFVQPDGSILIGGDFTTYNGIAVNRIARLYMSGSFDPGFDPGVGANSTISESSVQPDGKIIIGGNFTTYNGTPRSRIARLNTDGSLDAGFDPGVGASSNILSLSLQADGKIIVGGSFSTFGGISRGSNARLDADGSVDAGFNPGTGASSTVFASLLQADGKIIIGGNFTTFNGTPRSRIARLNTDGSLDAGFDPGTGANFTVLASSLQPDGKIIIAGDFTTYNETTRNRIARLNADGSLDAGFDPGTGANSVILSSFVQTDGKIIIGGDFTTLNGAARNRIARLNTDGSLDAGFDPGTGANMLVNSVFIQPDGKVIIGGDFTNYNGTSRSRIARLNADGSLDASFSPGLGANSSVEAMSIQSDGKILIGGSFTTYNGTSRSRIARLNADGSLDASFNPGTGASGIPYSFAHQADGKIIIGGNFTTYNGTARSRVARLNADGGLDASFNPGTGATSVIYTVALQADGKIIIGGNFTSYNGTGRNCIARVIGNTIVVALPPLTAPAGIRPAQGSRGNTSLGIAVYPNPASDYATLKINDAKLIGTVATLADADGRFLRSINILSTSLRVTLAGLPAGIYYLRPVAGETVRLVKR